MTVWTRPTSPWSVECEYNGQTRRAAIDFYKMRFGSAHKISLCAQAAVVLIAFSAFFMIPNICCFCVPQYLMMTGTVCRLIIWVIIPIIIHRLRLTSEIITAD